MTSFSAQVSDLDGKRDLEVCAHHGLKGFLVHTVLKNRFFFNDAITIFIIFSSVSLKTYSFYWIFPKEEAKS